MGWSESVDRVLMQRRMAELEAEKRELIRILQEVEQRCAVVVNRRVHEVLRDVPSWKDPEGKREQVRRTRIGGMRTFRDFQKRMERRLSTETRKKFRREREIEDVLGQNLGPVAKSETQGPSAGLAAGGRDDEVLAGGNDGGGEDGGA